MILRCWRFMRVVLLSLVPFLVIGVLIDTSDSFKKCIHESKSNHAYDALHEKNGVLISQIVRRIALHVACTRVTAGENGEAIGGLSGVVVALFTGTLWWVTRRMVNSVADQVQLAREEFIASHRPLMIIHSVRLLPSDPNTPPERQPLRAEFAIVNAGTGACEVTGSAVYLEYIPLIDRRHLPEMAANSVIRPRPYRVGDTDNAIPVETNCLGWNSHLNAIAEAVARRNELRTGIADVFWAPRNTLQLSGWLTYREANGNTRTTYFRRIYSHESERFIMSDDPDDEKTY